MRKSETRQRHDSYVPFKSMVSHTPPRAISLFFYIFGEFPGVRGHCNVKCPGCGDTKMWIPGGGDLSAVNPGGAPGGGCGRPSIWMAHNYHVFVVFRISSFEWGWVVISNSMSIYGLICVFPTSFHFSILPHYGKILSEIQTVTYISHDCEIGHNYLRLQRIVHLPFNKLGYWKTQNSVRD